MPPPVMNNPAPKKRPKFAPGSGTPKQRALMLGGVIVCVLAVLLIPTPTDEDDEVAANPAPPPQPPPVVKAVPITGQGFAAPLPGNVDSSVPSAASYALPPVSEITSFTPTTPDEIDKRIEALSQYFTRASQKDKNDALAALLEMKEVLIPRLPQLIKKCETGALAYYAIIAERLNAENCIDAIIDRLNGKTRPWGYRQLFSALSTFKGERAQRYVLNELKGKSIPLQKSAWEGLSSNMSPTVLGYALKVAGEGKGEYLSAADAVGRYGVEQAKALLLMDKIQPMLNTASAEGKLGLVRALAGMHSLTVSSVLPSYLHDTDKKVRLATIEGMARNPENILTLIQTFKFDADPDIQLACVRGMVANPTDDSLRELVKLVEHPKFMNVVHPALVRLNKGTDYGRYTFRWQAWFANGEHKDPAGRPNMVMKVTTDDPNNISP
jgi:hypothetical protein